MSYNERMSHLKLERLEIRRIHNDIIYAFRILKHKILEPNDFYSTPPHSTTRSSHLNLLYLPKFKSDCMKYSFAVRSAKYYNYLPEKVKNSVSVQCLKNQLTSLNFSIFLKGRT